MFLCLYVIIAVMHNTPTIALTTAILFLTGLMLTTVPFAFADQIKISIPMGSSVTGCESTDSCYIPSKVTIHPGDEVMWYNDDSAAHTVTSGTVSALDGKFDSGLFMSGKTFTNTFDTSGEYPYFCIVHPWMAGSIFVTVGGGIEIPMGTIIVGPSSEKETTVRGITSDGKIRVEIIASNPNIDDAMSIEVTFRDSSGGTVKKEANYDIIVIQNNKQVLQELGFHSNEGKVTHTTEMLESDEPVDIKITLLGFGSGEESQWSGPKGEVMMFNVVPEFGIIAMMILGITILCTIAITVKSRLAVKL